MTPHEFVTKWRRATLTERASAQPHFIDLCHLLGVPTPTDVDPTGARYTFEKGVTKRGGGQGWADVWYKGHFAWEYKRKGRNLNAAYEQLQLYREALENPPLLVVSDVATIEVHTNFTNMVKQVHRWTLEDLLDPQRLDQLRLLWTEPRAFRTTQTVAEVTEAAAREFARLAELLREQGIEASRAAHFLIRLLFCLFAEDVGLLPDHLFSGLLTATRSRPDAFPQQLRRLFHEMRAGGFFGVNQIAHFNGGLFDDDDVLELPREGLEILHRVSALDWSSIEPAIFGTLFERSLDPGKRAQLGAHYTSKEDILLIVEPVLMAPLRRRWEAVQAEAEALVKEREREDTTRKRQNRTDKLSKMLLDFSRELAGVRVLDPACGSGNFLYVALKQLLDLEKAVIAYAGDVGAQPFFPNVSPEQLHGIEVNEYAHELAQTTVWIGYIQWLRDNGFGAPSEPILKPIDTIHQMDAILAYDETGQPIDPAWPEAEVIIGNPPFLGDRKMRGELGDTYVEDVRDLYDDRLPHSSDFVCYWFERARALIEAGKGERAGLLATQAIRGGSNRAVMDRIKESGDIFWAESDRNWILDGANVHVSMVGFDGGLEVVKLLNGSPVDTINPDLTSEVDLTQAERLEENQNLSFIGTQKSGPFDLTAAQAHKMLASRGNPNGRPNSDVVKPWINATDITRGPRNRWIIDFGTDLPLDEAALYEVPFEYVRRHVKPKRDIVRRKRHREKWWLFGDARPGLRNAIAPLTRYIVTPMVAKHRLFAWIASHVIPENLLVVFARDDDYFFGVLQSRPHELWSRRLGTQLREASSGQRYTPTSAFETFPFPWPPGAEPADDPRIEAIAEAARALVEKRDAWLNPPGASEKELKKRTLTNLYNQRPAWLDLAHQRLDRAVLDAYGWPHDLSEEQILERLLALNLERAGKLEQGELSL